MDNDSPWLYFIEQVILLTGWKPLKLRDWGKWEINLNYSFLIMLYYWFTPAIFFYPASLFRRSEFMVSLMKPIQSRTEKCINHTRFDRNIVVPYRLHHWSQLPILSEKLVFLQFSSTILCRAWTLKCKRLRDSCVSLQKLYRWSALMKNWLTHRHQHKHTDTQSQHCMLVEVCGGLTSRLLVGWAQSQQQHQLWIAMGTCCWAICR